MIRIFKYGEVPNEEVFARGVLPMDVSAVVSDIIADVRQNGDKALFRYCEKFDKAKLDSLLVTQNEIEEALTAVDAKFIEILQKAAANIRRFHEKQVRNSFLINDTPGVVIGQKVVPLERVGLYVPGGTAAYPSTVLMDSIPAKIAGCGEVAIATPPNSKGKINPFILAAAWVAGVDRIYKVGGAQAIAALAYGTETVRRVDKIVGPGNAFVAEAKKQVFGRVAIDMIAGPSEILIIVDGKTNPAYAAADLLSQAEHDKMSSAVLVTDDMDFAKAVQAQIEAQLPKLIREEIARTSIENNGKIIVADNLDQAIDIANEIAPEHLELCVDQPFDILDKIRHAGSIFLGRNCPEALGDYFAGPNHTLPTVGTARFSNPLSVDDFVKKMQYSYYSRDALSKVARDVAYFAEKEGLTGHARSAVIRTEDDMQ